MLLSLAQALPDSRPLSRLGSAGPLSRSWRRQRLAAASLAETLATAIPVRRKIMQQSVASKASRRSSWALFRVVIHGRPRYSQVLRDDLH